MKDTINGVEPKAKHVARGFEDNLNQIQKDSPTCSKDTLRTVQSVLCQKAWNLENIDTKAATFQGDSLNRDVFVEPPVEADCNESFLWKLDKCIHGLSDSSFMWYDRFRKFMSSCKSKVSRVDPALFLWHEGCRTISCGLGH